MRAKPFGTDKWGAATCLYCPATTAPACGRPAQWHAMVNAEDSTALCTDHLVRVSDAIPDLHAFGGVCGIPGAVFHRSTPGETGHCSIPLTDSRSLTNHTPITEGAHP